MKSVYLGALLTFISLGSAEAGMFDCPDAAVVCQNPNKWGVWGIHRVPQEGKLTLDWVKCTPESRDLGNACQAYGGILVKILPRNGGERGFTNLMTDDTLDKLEGKGIDPFLIEIALDQIPREGVK